jgi:hypothetical protein
MNVVQTWLYLIGNPERAKKLRSRVDGLKPPVLDPEFGPEPKQCPTTILFDAKTSRKLYADPLTRPALDAWDCGLVDKDDLWAWCNYVERGLYQGPTYHFVPEQFFSRVLTTSTDQTVA